MHLPYRGLQGNTILAMDFMENGNLWDQLPRTNKAGQHIFQWRFRGKKVAYEIALGLHCLHDLKCEPAADLPGSCRHACCWLLPTRPPAHCQCLHACTCHITHHAPFLLLSLCSVPEQHNG